MVIPEKLDQLRRVIIGDGKNGGIASDFRKLFPVKSQTMIFPVGDEHKGGASLTKTGPKALKALLVHTFAVVGDAQGPPVAQTLKTGPHLKTTAVVINADIADAFCVLTVAVVHHKGDPHPVSQGGIVLLAKAHDDQPVHVPHGGELDDLFHVPRLFDHHKLPALFDLGGEVVEGGGDIAVFQGAAFVFLVVVDHDADNAGAVLGQEDSGHTGDVLTLLQQGLHSFHGLVGDLFGLSVQHIGNRGRAQAQLPGNIRYSYPFVIQRHHPCL